MPQPTHLRSRHGGVGAEEEQELTNLLLLSSVLQCFQFSSGSTDQLVLGSSRLPLLLLFLLLLERVH